MRQRQDCPFANAVRGLDGDRGDRRLDDLPWPGISAHGRMIAVAIATTSLAVATRNIAQAFSDAAIEPVLMPTKVSR
jgi:hypothetical protein